jgi:hypothetical protein
MFLLRLLFNYASEYVITNVQGSEVRLKLNGTQQSVCYAASKEAVLEVTAKEQRQ